jgi:DNA-binding HxlR family transcriptional regulator
MARPAPASEIPAWVCAAAVTAAFGSCYCSVEDLSRLIRRGPYSLAVLNAVQSHGTARFNNIDTTLRGIGTSTLSDTLWALPAAGLLDRRHRPSRPCGRTPRSPRPAPSYPTNSAGSWARCVKPDRAASVCRSPALLSHPTAGGTVAPL